MNEIGISLVIEITPPFTQTWWFRIIVFLTLCCMIFGIFHLRLRSIKGRNKELEEKVKTRTIELQKANLDLEQRQKHILKQSNELKVQKEALIQQNNELEEANAVKDRLFSIVAHDLRNPFNAIIGYAELLHTDYSNFDEETKVSMVTQIYKSSIKYFDLLEQLLNWAMSQMGKISFNPKRDDLVHLIGENIAVIKEQAQGKDISINSKQDKEELMLQLDKNLVNTIIRNLLTKCD